MKTISLLYENIFVDEKGKFYEGDWICDYFGHCHPNLIVEKAKKITKRELLKRFGWKDIKRIGDTYRIYSKPSF